MFCFVFFFILDANSYLDSDLYSVTSISDILTVLCEHWQLGESTGETNAASSRKKSFVEYFLVTSSGISRI